MNTNFRQDLLELSKDWDTVFSILKKSYSDEKLGNWIVALFLYVLSDVKSFKTLPKLIPSIIGILVSSGVMIIHNQMLVKSLIALFIFIIFFSFNLYLYLRKMLNFNEEKYFHIGAYRVFRKSEYNGFIKYIPSRDFSFKGLYDEIIYNIPEAKELEVKKAQIKDMKVIHEEYVKNSTEDQNKLLLQIKEHNAQISMIVKLLKDINTALYQMTNECFDSSSLLFITGFTIHEKRDNKLIKIMDRGTTGKTLKEYDIPDTITEKSDAVLRALSTKERYTPQIDIPYKNHFIMSFKMRMAHDKIWVFNFQSDYDDDRALFFLMNNDMLDTREVFRLIHALCLILQEKGVYEYVER
ncbi:hypothetical protein [Ectobacillus polymachus]|uniref:hypothetical protein n=1 Tax=Ectobacillus polymachus TaxID=1508806 RepID=UPI003A8A7329